MRTTNDVVKNDWTDVAQTNYGRFTSRYWTNVVRDGEIVAVVRSISDRVMVIPSLTDGKRCNGVFESYQL